MNINFIDIYDFCIPEEFRVYSTTEQLLQKQGIWTDRILDNIRSGTVQEHELHQPLDEPIRDETLMLLLGLNRAWVVLDQLEQLDQDDPFEARYRTDQQKRLRLTYGAVWYNGCQLIGADPMDTRIDDLAAEGSILELDERLPRRERSKRKAPYVSFLLVRPAIQLTRSKTKAELWDEVQYRPPYGDRPINMWPQYNELRNYYLAFSENIEETNELPF